MEENRVIGACPFILLQIRGGLDQDGSAIKVRHTVELLAEQLED